MRCGVCWWQKGSALVVKAEVEGRRGEVEAGRVRVWEGECEVGDEVGEGVCARLI